MRAWRVHRPGRPSLALRLDEIERPRPGPLEVSVRVRSAALNFNEVDGCRGRYLTVNPPLPYTLGMEVMGVVDAAGAGAEHWLGRRSDWSRSSFGPPLSGPHRPTPPPWPYLPKPRSAPANSSDSSAARRTATATGPPATCTRWAASP